MAGQFLKCDADGCDHRERIESLLPEMIGKPCPKCGADLLTRQDYLDGKRIELLVAAMVDAGLVQLTDDESVDPSVSVVLNTHDGVLHVDGAGLRVSIGKAGE